MSPNVLLTICIGLPNATVGKRYGWLVRFYVGARRIELAAV